MPTKTQDWPVEEGDETNAVQADVTPAQPTAPGTPRGQATLPGATTIAPPVSPAPQRPQAQEKDAFPDDWEKANELLRELSRFRRLGDRPTPEQRAGHWKYHRLCKHMHAAQQGLPVISTNSHSVGAFVGLSISDKTRWATKARTDRDFKKLLAAHNALAKENAELKELLS